MLYKGINFRNDQSPKNWSGTIYFAEFILLFAVKLTFTLNPELHDDVWSTAKQVAGSPSIKSLKLLLPLDTISGEGMTDGRSRSMSWPTYSLQISAKLSWSHVWRFTFNFSNDFQFFNPKKYIYLSCHEVGFWGLWTGIDQRYLKQTDFLSYIRHRTQWPFTTELQSELH